jgi:hypothetical protein
MEKNPNVPPFWWMNKQNMIFLYTGILLSNKKERNMCYNMDKPYKYYAMEKKLEVEDYILC